jgi:hypothetical protein
MLMNILLAKEIMKTSCKVGKKFFAILLQHLENKILRNQVLNHWIARQGPRPENLVLI